MREIETVFTTVNATESIYQIERTYVDMYDLIMDEDKIIANMMNSGFDVTETAWSIQTHDLDDNCLYKLSLTVEYNG